jgi:hypothetical protein
MSNKNVCIPLESRIDGEGRKYYIAKIEAPISINCENGATFLVFVSENGAEELQIAKMAVSKIKVKKEVEIIHNQ